MWGNWRFESLSNVCCKIKNFYVEISVVLETHFFFWRKNELVLEENYIISSAFSDRLSMWGVSLLIGRNL